MIRFFRIVFLGCIVLPSIALQAQTLTPVPGTGLDAVRNAEIQWADLNNDGRADMVLTGNNKSGTIFTRLYLNDGDSTFSDITGGIVQVFDADIALADYNNDGNLDIAIAGNSNAAGTTASLNIYRSNGAATPIYTEVSAGMDELADAGLAWADLNRDGWLDLIATGTNALGQDSTYIYQNNQGTGFTALSHAVAGLSDGDLAVLDYNRDGLTDLLLMGINSSGINTTSLYRNEGEFSFTLQSSGFAGLAFGEIATADYNEDGFTDVFLTGLDNSSNRVAILYRNASGVFINSGETFYPVESSSVAFGDLTNSGRTDIVLAGSSALGDTTMVYTSDASYAFTNVVAGPSNLILPDVALADFNADSVLDLYVTGFNILLNDDLNELLSNEETTDNAPPSAPGGLNATTNEDSVFLSWTAPADDRSATAGLSYQLYMGTATATDDALPAHADIATGARKLYRPGMQEQRTQYQLQDLPEDNYFWSVQAIDQSYMGSAFATEGTFTICYSPDLGADTALCVGDTLSLSAGIATDVVNWYSTSLGGLAQANSPSFDLPVSIDDTVVVEITKVFGCTVYDTLLVDALALPAFTLGADTAICFDESLPLVTTGVDFDSTNWYTALQGQVLLDDFNYTHPVTTKDTVWAEVYNLDGCLNYDTIIVDVIALPVPDLGADTAICFNEAILLSPGSGFDSTNWFTLLGSSLALNSSTLNYTVLTKDTLIAEVFNPSRCVNYDTIIVDVIDLPLPNLGNDQQVCFDEFTLLSPGTGFDSVNWFTDAGATIQLNSPTLNYQVTASITVVAEVFNVNRCVNYDTINLTAVSLPMPSLGADTAICFQEFIELVPGTGFDSVNWFTQAGDTLLLDRDTLNYQVLATDTLIVEVFQSLGCVNYDTLIVAVIDLPQPDLGADTAICFQEFIELSPGTGFDSTNWFTLAGDTLLLNSATLDYQVLVTDTLITEVFNSSGCVNYDTAIVQVIDLPQPALGADTAICFQELVALSPGTGFDSVNWFTLSGNTLLLDRDTLNYQVLAKDTLIAEVFNSSACVNYDTIIVDVFDLPQPALGADTAICFQEVIELQPGMVFDSTNWYTLAGDTLQLGVDTLNYQVLVTDTLITEVFNSNACVNYDTIIVTVIDLPQPDLGADTAICFMESIVLSPGTGFDSTNWYTFAGDTLLANSATLNYQVLFTDTLVAEVFNASGCVNYDTTIVQVIDLPQPNLGADTAICFQEVINLVPGTGFDSVNWFTLAGATLELDSDTLQYQVLTTDTLISEVFNASGCVNYDTIVVDVLQLPVFDLGADTAVCVESQILFNLGIGWANVDWSTNQLGLRSSGSFFYNYEALITDTLTAIVTDTLGCINYDTIAVRVFDIPTVDIGADTAICFGESVDLTPGPGWAQVAWSGVSQGALAVVDTLDYTVLQTDRLVATVTTTDGCIFADSAEVAVLALPDYDLGLDSALCVGEPVSISPGPGWTRVDWFDQDSIIRVADQVQIDYTVTTDSTWISRVVDALGCVEFDTIRLSAKALPVFELGPEQFRCFGDSLTVGVDTAFATVNWYDPINLRVADQDTITLQVTRADTLAAEVFNAAGCVSYDTLLYRQYDLPQVSAGPDTLICFEQSVPIGGMPTALPATSTFTYQWAPAAGLDDASLANPVATPMEDRRYTVLVTDQNNCQNSDSMTVFVNPENSINPGGDRPICIFDDTMLGGDPTAAKSLFDYTYDWTPTVGLDDPTLSNPTANPEETTTYRLIVSTRNCKPDTAFVTVTVNPLPILSITPDTTIGPDESILLEVSGAQSYIWTPDNGLSNPLIAMPDAAPNQTTTYTVLATDANGCQDEISMEIIVANTLFIPNLFTPNNDNSNDRFLVFGSGFRELELEIYDRQGNLMYSSSDIEQITQVGWDGTNDGEPLPNGNYFWQLQGFYTNGAEVRFAGKNSGIIKLIR